MINKFQTLISELTRPMPLERNFTDYDDYWQNRGFDTPAVKRAEKIARHLEPNSRIMDIGCGDGVVMAFLMEHLSPKEVVGIDISQKSVDYVKAKGMEAHQFDVLSEDFKKYLKGKKFDYIIITEVLEHIQDPEILIELLKKHVNKAIFVSIPNAGFFTNRLRLLFGSFPLVMIQEHVKEHIRFWTKRDFFYWAKYHGFEIENAIVSIGLGVNALRPIERTMPNLFAKQIVYQLVKAE